MCDLLGSLGNSLDLVDVFSTFDRELRRLIYYDAITVHLVDNGRLAPAYAAGRDVASRLASTEDLDLLIRVAVARQAAINELCRTPGSLEFALVFPVENETEVIGTLALYRRESRPFSKNDLDLLDVVGVKLSASIENARKFQLAAESAATDPATGLANGRSLFQHLDAELARARRGETRLAVLQCSVEGFDESNWVDAIEPARHAFEKVAARLRESCREYDLSARTGDDLVLVLPGFRPSDLADKCGQIQKIVEETGLSAGLPLFVTVGAAFYPEDGRDAEDLLAESARRLNVAKQFNAGGEHAAGPF